MEFEMRYVWKILFGKLQGRRTCYRMKHTWLYNIEMNLTKIGMCGVGTTGSEKNAFVITVMNLIFSWRKEIS
jgi:hypothetical protein